MSQFSEEIIQSEKSYSVPKIPRKATEIDRPLPNIEEAKKCKQGVTLNFPPGSSPSEKNEGRGERGKGLEANGFWARACHDGFFRFFHFDLHRLAFLPITLWFRHALLFQLYEPLACIRVYISTS